MVWEVERGSLGGDLGAVSGPTFWHICPQLGPTGPNLLNCWARFLHSEMFAILVFNSMSIPEYSHMPYMKQARRDTDRVTKTDRQTEGQIKGQTGQTDKQKRQNTHTHTHAHTHTHN